MPEGSRPARKKAFRPDIQGLRALAVAVVVLNHMFEWPVGGFIGVDIFFVISGFLITGHLLREYRTTGRISFADFYRRRVRRIFPVSTLVLLVVVGAGWLVYLSARAQDITLDAIWAFVFAANWHLAADGTNYWANDGTTSPLQHYWSLAVEEQFYFVWPLLITLILAVAQIRKRLSGTTALIAVMGLIVVASFVWATTETLTNPTWAYFSTFSRTWELGVGALLAIAQGALARIPSAARPVLGWLGLFGIFASLFLISEGSGFPAPWAALPVLATALVIAGGTGGVQRFLFPLTNPVSGYIGDISFSLYLWHFPVIVLLPSLLQIDGPLYAVISLSIMVALTIASYHLIENPIRRSSWLEPGRKKNLNRRRLRRDEESQKAQLAWLAALATVTTVLVVVALQPPTAPVSASRYQSTAATDDTSASAAEPATAETAETALSAAVLDAVKADSYPELTPSIDSLGTEAWFEQMVKDGCADVDEKNMEDCVFGPPTSDLDVVVLGDSFAMAWMPAVRGAFEPLGYKVHQLTRGQCPAGTLNVLANQGAPFPECATHRAWSQQQTMDIQPDIIIVGDARNSMTRLVSGVEGEEAASEIQKGYEKTIADLSATGAKIFILASPPETPALKECVTRIGTPKDCTSDISADWKLYASAQREAASSGATFVDTKSWFCTDAGRCPGFVGTTPVRADTGHMTLEFSAELAPVLAGAIVPAL